MLSFGSTSRQPHRRISVLIFTVSGIWLIGLGLYFALLRPALLPEDPRYIGSSLAQIQAALPGLERWLSHVFVVMGGFMAASGLLTIFLALTAVGARRKGIGIVLLLAGLGGLVRPSDTGIRNVLIAETVPGYTAQTWYGVFAPARTPQPVIDRLLRSAGLRIRGITDTTRQRVQETIAAGIAEGLGAAELGDRLEAAGIFSELRAETIARTETATVLNEAAVAQYRELGVDRVQVVDGDDDEACASVDGAIWTVDEAEANPIAHPNCVRSFTPLIGAPA